MNKPSLTASAAGAMWRSGRMRALIAVALAALVSFCVLVERPAKAQTVPNVVDFGDLLVGATENEIVRITNPLDVALEVDVELLGDTGGFTVVDPVTGTPITGTITLGPAEVVDLSVNFAPTSAGPQNGVIDLSVLGLEASVLTEDALLELRNLGLLDFDELAGIIDLTDPDVVEALEDVVDLEDLADVLGLSLADLLDLIANTPGGLLEILGGLTDAQLLELLEGLTDAELSQLLGLLEGLAVDISPVVNLGDVTLVGVGTAPQPTPDANTAPQVSVDQPVKNKIKQRKPTISGTARDAQEELDKADIRVTLNGQAVTNFTYDQATDKVQFVPDQKLKRGKKYTVRITATDAQGLSTTAEKTFKVKKKKNNNRR